MTKPLNQIEDKHYIRQISHLLSESVFLKLDESLFSALYIVCVFFWILHKWNQTEHILSCIVFWWKFCWYLNLRLMIVLACLDCYSNYNISKWLINTWYLFITVLKAGSLRLDWVLMRAFFLVRRHLSFCCAQTSHGRRECPGLFHEGTNPVHGLP